MSTPYHNIPLRSARDRIITLLFSDLPKSGDDPLESDPDELEPGADEQSVRAIHQQVLPYPLKDLPVAVENLVKKNKTAEIFILGAQEDTAYVLCNANGQPINANSQLIDETSNPPPSEYIQGEIRTLPEGKKELLKYRLLYRSDDTESLNLPKRRNKADWEAFSNTWKRAVVLTTPKIEKDQTFRIRAKKDIITHPDVNFQYLGVYLHQEISIRVGIDTALNVQFVPQQAKDTVSDEGLAISVDFNPKQLVVEVLNSQAGIRYQLREKVNDVWVKRSDVVQGGSQGLAGDMKIKLLTTGSFEEDTTLIVHAFRNEEDDDTLGALLDNDLVKKLHVLVRPRNDLSVILEQGTVPYEADTTIKVKGIQASVDYQLYSRELDLLEYTRKGKLEIQDVNTIKNLRPIGDVQSGADGATLSFDTTEQKEDSVFVIQATKRESQVQLNLSKAPVLLVQPDPSPQVSIEASPIASGAKGVILVNNTQRGVKYKLGDFELAQKGLALSPADSDNPGPHLARRSIGRSDVNNVDHGMRIEIDFVVGNSTDPPDKAANNKTAGYHVEERAIGKITDRRREYGTRIGIDTRIGKIADTPATLYPDPAVRLPTGDLTESTSFAVLAIKSYTGLATVLTQTVEVQVEHNES